MFGRLLSSPRSFPRLALVAVVACALGASVVRPASAIVYAGTPDLALTSDMVAAGGGPGHFSAMKLVGFLAAAKAGPEVAKLTKQFGASGVSTTISVFDYAVGDVVRVATAEHITLPAPTARAKDPRALSIALYRAGTSPSGKWDVGYMLEHLVTHPIHHVIMHDIDAKFGAKQNEIFHIGLTQVMHDLAAVYA